MWKCHRAISVSSNSNSKRLNFRRQFPFLILQDSVGSRTHGCSNVCWHQVKCNYFCYCYYYILRPIPMRHLSFCTLFTCNHVALQITKEFSFHMSLSLCRHFVTKLGWMEEELMENSVANYTDAKEKQRRK